MTAARLAAVEIARVHRWDGREVRVSERACFIPAEAVRAPFSIPAPQPTLPQEG